MDPVKTIDLDLIKNKFIEFCDVSSSTERIYLSKLNFFLEYLGMNNLDPLNLKTNHILAFKKFLIKKGYSASTINLYLVVIKKFFKMMEKEFGYYNNPAEKVDNLKITRTFKRGFLTKREVIQLLNTIDTTTLSGKRDYIIILMMLTTGLRLSSCQNANKNDIKFQGNTILMRVRTKRHLDKDKIVLLPPRLYSYIENYLNLRDDDCNALFVSHSNFTKAKRLSKRAIRKRINKWLKEAGLKKPHITCHSFRHTSAQFALELKNDLLAIKEHLHHEHITTTQIYLHTNRVKNRIEQQIENFLFD